MIDDPDTGPVAQRRWPRPVRSEPQRPPGPRPEAQAGLGPAAEPGWGDPFASYATLSDPDAAGRSPDAIREHDAWTLDAPSDVSSVASGVDGGPHAGPAGADAGPGPGGGGAGSGRPFMLTLLRPWFEPRPGELRGAIVLLSVALAVSVALWFDASRRPQVLRDAGASSASTPAPVPAAGADGTTGVPGRADGSDGWGLTGASPVPRGPVVHVSGAVARPGVVTVPERARVADAIEAVGGAMPDARLDRLNLARIVEDGERIHVPRVGEDAPPPDEPASRGVLADGRIDLNAASQAELETLPGVGPARAQAIIAERGTRPFRVPGDLRRVPGIGEATFQRLAPLVAVR